MKKLTIMLVFLLSIFSVYGCENSDRLENDHQHTASSWIVEKEASCTESGTQIRKCITCGELLETKEISKLSHVGRWQVVTEANCEHEGLSENICINCNQILGSKTIQTHNKVYQSAVEATCTTSGSTKGSYCKDCGMIFEEQTVISAYGHNYQIIPAVTATCTSYGWTEGEKCSRCDIVSITPERISKTDHHFVELSALSPTCTEEGRESGGKKCTACNEKQYQTIPALGHDYDSYTGICSRCGQGEHKRYTIWEEFANNYSNDQSFILDLRNMDFKSSVDYIITINSHHNYVRVIGDENTVYPSLFFVISTRTSEISIDFMNVRIRNQSQNSTTAVITSESPIKINIGFYGNSCEISGLNGKDGSSVVAASPTKGYDGCKAIDADGGTVNIFCSAVSTIISGGDGGHGGGSALGTADGGDGAYAVYAAEIHLSFAAGKNSDNISITGGKGGKGGTYIFYSNGNKGVDSSATNVEMKYN